MKRGPRNTGGGRRHWGEGRQVHALTLCVCLHSFWRHDDVRGCRRCECAQFRARPAGPALAAASPRNPQGSGIEALSQQAWKAARRVRKEVEMTERAKQAKREEAIVQDWQSGLSQAELARRYGQSGSRVGAILLRHREKARERIPPERMVKEKHRSRDD